LSLARRALVACLLAGALPAAQGDEVKAPAPQKPAPAAATAPKPAAAKAPATAPDDDLLEFLGSVDSEGGDEAWLEYLSQADIGKVARGHKPAPAAPEGDEK
jgi:hypothetical protein